MRQSIGNVEFSLRGVVHFSQFAEDWVRANPVDGIDAGDRGIALSDEPLPEGQIHARWTLSMVRAASERDDFLYQWLTQAWIVMTYARWEKYWRPRIAEARGVVTNSVECDVMGDLRLLRHDVCHHRGVATAANTGQCIVLQEIAVGKEIVLSAVQLAVVTASLQVR